MPHRIGVAPLTALVLLVGHGVGISNTINPIVWDQVQTFSLTGTPPPIIDSNDSLSLPYYEYYPEFEVLSFIAAPTTFTVGGVNYSLTGISLNIDASLLVEDQIECHTGSIWYSGYTYGSDGTLTFADFDSGELPGSPQDDMGSVNWSEDLDIGVLDSWAYDIHDSSVSENVTVDYTNWMSYFETSDPTLTLMKYTALELIDHDARDSYDYVQENSGTGVGGGTLGWTGTATLEYTFSASPETGVPEPATLLLIGAGLIGLGALRRRMLHRIGVALLAALALLVGHGIGAAATISPGPNGQILWDQQLSFSLTGLAPQIADNGDSLSLPYQEYYPEFNVLSFGGAPATFVAGDVTYSLTGVSLLIDGYLGVEDGIGCHNGNEVYVTCSDQGEDLIWTGAYPSGTVPFPSEVTFDQLDTSFETEGEGWYCMDEPPFLCIPLHPTGYNDVYTSYTGTATLDYSPWLSYFESNGTVSVTLEKDTYLTFVGHDARDTDDSVEEVDSGEFGPVGWTGTATLEYTFSPSANENGASGGVPEPATLLLTGAGLISLGASLRRKR